jgi:ABC-type multidrug transport system fused ATPase/permease subunit
MLSFRQLGLFGLTSWRIGLFVALTLATAVFEGFGMASLFPVLEYAEKGQDVSELSRTSRMWQILVATFGALGIKIDLLVLVVSAIGMMLLRVFFVYARQVYTAWLAQEMQHCVRSKLFEAYLAMDIGSFSRLSSGGLINILTTEAQRAAGSFSALFALAANIAVCSGFALVLLWLSTPLTLLALVFLGVSAAAVSVYARNTQSQSHAATAASDRYSRMALERLTAVRLIKLTATIDRECFRVRDASQSVGRQLYVLARGIASVDLIMEPMVLISGGAILYLAIGVFGMSLGSRDLCAYHA